MSLWKSRRSRLMPNTEELIEFLLSVRLDIKKRRRMGREGEEERFFFFLGCALYVQTPPPKLRYRVSSLTASSLPLHRCFSF
jgi:hypothetical protein